MCKLQNILMHTGGEDAKMIRTAREVNTYKTE